MQKLLKGETPPPPPQEGVERLELDEKGIVAKWAYLRRLRDTSRDDLHTHKQTQPVSRSRIPHACGRSTRSYRTMPTPKGGCWLAATSSGRRVSSFGAAEAIHPEDGRFVVQE